MWLFTREAAVGITRTVVSFLWAWLVSRIPAVTDFLESIGVDESLLIIALGGLLYTGIRWAAEKWEWLGSLLIFNKKPTY